MSTGGLGLIDEELAEHERWSSASAAVGGAGSEQRAEFIAKQVGGGAIEGFETGFVMGLLTTIGIQAVEAGVELVAGAAIPGVGQVIGGVMAGISLVENWDKNMGAIGKMGEGRSGYEEAANDIEGICAILDIISNVLNVMAGVAGAVAVVGAIVAIVTVGVLTPLPILAGQIALAIGVAGMVVGLVKMALQPLVLLFRSLHAFTSQADPREIEGQGGTLRAAGGEMGGALGGLAGAAAGGALTEEGEHPSPTGEAEPTPSPAAAGSGEPLVVEGEPPTSGAPPTEMPPTEMPPTEMPPTEMPPTEMPPTQMPPTEMPPTEMPPTQPAAPGQAQPTMVSPASSRRRRRCLRPSLRRGARAWHRRRCLRPSCRRVQSRTRRFPRPRGCRKTSRS